MDEMQIEALRAALHRWIDQATDEQLEQMDREVQSMLADNNPPRAVYIPFTVSPQEETAEPKSYRIVYTSEERRAETDRLANERRREMFEKRDNERKEQLKRLLGSDT